MKTPITFGRIIKEARLQRGLSIQELADASQTSYMFIHRLEHDQGNCSVDRARALAAILRTKLSRLIDAWEKLTPHP